MIKRPKVRVNLNFHLSLVREIFGANFLANMYSIKNAQHYVDINDQMPLLSSSNTHLDNFLLLLFRYVTKLLSTHRQLPTLDNNPQ
jgi:hypothetical protein